MRKYERIDTYMETLGRTIKITHEKVKRNVQNQNKHDEVNYNRNRWNKEINVSDEVLVKSENRKGFEKRYVGPFIGKWTYILHNELLGKTIQRNYNQVRKVPVDRDSYVTTTIDTTMDQRQEYINKSIISGKREERRYLLRTTRNPNPRYR